MIRECISSLVFTVAFSFKVPESDADTDADADADALDLLLLLASEILPMRLVTDLEEE